MLVLIGSHSRCNSFVVNQFLFFSHQMEKIPFVIHPRSNETNMLGKKCFVYFLLAFQDLRATKCSISPVCNAIIVL